MLAQPKVYIIILNWNGLKDTIDCLESVDNLNYPNYQVVVVDNASTDNSVQILEHEYPNLTLIRNKENLGYTGGNNVAVKYAMDHGADYVWLLNNDTVVQDDSLTKLVAAAEKGPEIGLVSPLIYYYDKPDTIQFCGSYVDKKKYSIIKIDRPEDLVFTSEQVIILWGTALLIKAAVIEKIGSLNNKYFAYHEDCEYGMRAARSGYKSMVEIGAIVFHKDSKSTGNRYSPLQCFLRTRNFFYLWADSLSGLERVNYYRYFFSGALSTMAQFADKGLNDAVEASLEGVWCALKGQGGPRTTEGLVLPVWFRRTFYFFIKNHPYLWVLLLRGEFMRITLDLMKRVKSKMNINRS